MQDDYKEIFESAVKSAMAFFVTVLMLLLACTMCGCKTREYVPIESVRTEQAATINEVRVTDSVSNEHLVFVQGDTVIYFRWRDRWRTETKHDSIYVNRTDTIRVPYPVEKRVEVERKRRWWETTLIWMGGISGISALILLPFCYYKRVTKN